MYTNLLLSKLPYMIYDRESLSRNGNTKTRVFDKEKKTKILRVEIQILVICYEVSTLNMF